jgi:hypothetical protein
MAERLQLFRHLALLADRADAHGLDRVLVGAAAISSISDFSRLSSSSSMFRFRFGLPRSLALRCQKSKKNPRLGPASAGFSFQV